jgi:hypothetical protein
MGGVFALAVVLTAAAAIAGSNVPQPPTLAERTPPPPAEVSTAPRETTPPEDITMSMASPEGLLTLVSLETSAEDAEDLNLNAPGRATPRDDAATGASSVVESPGTIASSWSMPPLPEDGSWAASGTSQTPVTKTSSSVMSLPH